MPFLKVAQPVGVDFDVMIEAKQKDQAMFRLIADLAAQPGVTQIEQAAVAITASTFTTK
jgi:UV DNA damage endonuclease